MSSSRLISLSRLPPHPRGARTYPYALRRSLVQSSSSLAEVDLGPASPPSPSPSPSLPLVVLRPAFTGGMKQREKKLKHFKTPSSSLPAAHPPPPPPSSPSLSASQPSTDVDPPRLSRPPPSRPSYLTALPSIPQVLGPTFISAGEGEKELGSKGVKAEGGEKAKKTTNKKGTSSSTSLKSLSIHPHANERPISLQQPSSSSTSLPPPPPPPPGFLNQTSPFRTIPSLDLVSLTRRRAGEVSEVGGGGGGLEGKVGTVKKTKTRSSVQASPSSRILKPLFVEVSSSSSAKRWKQLSVHSLASTSSRRVPNPPSSRSSRFNLPPSPSFLFPQPTSTTQHPFHSWKVGKVGSPSKSAPPPPVRSKRQPSFAIPPVSAAPAPPPLRPPPLFLTRSGPKKSSPEKAKQKKRARPPTIEELWASRATLSIPPASAIPPPPSLSPPLFLTHPGKKELAPSPTKAKAPKPKKPTVEQLWVESRRLSDGRLGFGFKNQRQRRSLASPRLAPVLPPPLWNSPFGSTPPPPSSLSLASPFPRHVKTQVINGQEVKTLRLRRGTSAVADGLATAFQGVDLGKLVGSSSLKKRGTYRGGNAVGSERYATTRRSTTPAPSTTLHGRDRAPHIRPSPSFLTKFPSNPKDKIQPPPPQRSLTPFLASPSKPNGPPSRPPLRPKGHPSLPNWMRALPPSQQYSLLPSQGNGSHARQINARPTPPPPRRSIPIPGFLIAPSNATGRFSNPRSRLAIPPPAPPPTSLETNPFSQPPPPEFGSLSSPRRRLPPGPSINWTKRSTLLVKKSTTTTKKILATSASSSSLPTPRPSKLPRKPLFLFNKPSKNLIDQMERLSAGEGVGVEVGAEPKLKLKTSSSLSTSTAKRNGIALPPPPASLAMGPKDRFAAPLLLASGSGLKLERGLGGTKTRRDALGASASGKGEKDGKAPALSLSLKEWKETMWDAGKVQVEMKTSSTTAAAKTTPLVRSSEPSLLTRPSTKTKTGKKDRVAVASTSSSPPPPPSFLIKSPFVGPRKMKKETLLFGMGEAKKEKGEKKKLVVKAPAIVSLPKDLPVPSFLVKERNATDLETNDDGLSTQEASSFDPRPSSVSTRPVLFSLPTLLPRIGATKPPPPLVQKKIVVSSEWTREAPAHIAASTPTPTPSSPTLTSPSPSTTSPSSPPSFLAKKPALSAKKIVVSPEWTREAPAHFAASTPAPKNSPPTPTSPALPPTTSSTPPPSFLAKKPTLPSTTITPKGRLGLRRPGLSAAVPKPTVLYGLQPTYSPPLTSITQQPPPKTYVPRPRKTPTGSAFSFAQQLPPPVPRLVPSTSHPIPATPRRVATVGGSSALFDAVRRVDMLRRNSAAARIAPGFGRGAGGGISLGGEAVGKAEGGEWMVGRRRGGGGGGSAEEMGMGGF